MKIITGTGQRSPEWFQARLGSVGGSTIKDVLAKGNGRSRKNLLYQLAGEIITGESHTITATPAMERGIELEIEARDTFEFMTGLEVSDVDLIQGDLSHTHISPDGLIESSSACLEIKCRMAKAHVAYLDTQELLLNDKRQVQYCMYITGYEFGYFFAYHPLMKPFFKKVMPDLDMQAQIKIEIKMFSADLDALVDKIK